MSDIRDELKEFRAKRIKIAGVVWAKFPDRDSVDETGVPTKYINHHPCLVLETWKDKKNGSEQILTIYGTSQFIKALNNVFVLKDMVFLKKIACGREYKPTSWEIKGRNIAKLPKTKEFFDYKKTFKPSILPLELKQEIEEYLNRTEFKTLLFYIYIGETKCLPKEFWEKK